MPEGWPYRAPDDPPNINFSFNHLVGAGEEGGRNREAERFRRLQIDDEFKMSRLDGVSMILLTLPVVLPIVVGAGFDPIWFGIFLIIVIEMAELSPPVGFNLFVLQNMTGRDVFTIGWMSLPFFLMMVVTIVLLTIWPQIVTVLPSLYS